MPAHKFKIKEVRGKWDIASYAGLPAATTTVTVDFSNLSKHTYNKIVQLVEAYPHEVPRCGYGSKAYKLFKMLCEYHDVPMINIKPYGITLRGITDPTLWQEMYDLCFADALAGRMESRNNHRLTYLEAGKERYQKQGEIHYWYGSHEFYEALQTNEIMQQTVKFLRESTAERMEKAYNTAAYGGCITMQLTK